MSDEPFTTEVLTIGLRSSYGPVLVWIVGVISIGLGVQFAMEAGLDNRIAGAIALPLVLGCMVLFVKSSLGDGNTLSISDGVLTAKRGRRKDRVPLASAQISLGHWTAGTSEGGAKLVGPVLILDIEGCTTTVGTTDPQLAQSLAAHLGPLVKSDPAFVVSAEAFREIHRRL